MSDEFDKFRKGLHQALSTSPSELHIDKWTRAVQKEHGSMKRRRFAPLWIQIGAMAAMLVMGIFIGTRVTQDGSSPTVAPLENGNDPYATIERIYAKSE